MRSLRKFRVKTSIVERLLCLGRTVMGKKGGVGCAGLIVAETDVGTMFGNEVASTQSVKACSANRK